ncbi:MAG: hypothetical protein M3552_02075, partial [Planctomycetota bacterium]|nr:hypothetical protein [Planctomycetota bacterium]
LGPLEGISTTNGSVFVGTTADSLIVARRVAAAGAASDLGLVAGVGGDVDLRRGVAAGRSAAIVAGGGIFQSAPGFFVNALSASFDAKAGSVGANGDPLDIRVGTVAAMSPLGGVFLRQAADRGDLTIGTVPAVLGLPSISGITSGGAAVVSTTNGALFGMAPVSAGEVRLTANGGGMVLSASTTATGIVELTTTGGAELRGSITGTTVTATAAQGLVLTNAVTATGNVSLTALNIDVAAVGTIDSGSTDITAALGTLNVAGDIIAAGHAALTARVIEITGAGSLDSSSMTISATAGALTVNGSVVAAGVAELSGTTIGVGAAGLVSGQTTFVASTLNGISVEGRVAAENALTLSGSAVTVDAGGNVTAGTATINATGGAVTIAGRADTVANATLTGLQLTVTAGGIVESGGLAALMARTVSVNAGSAINAGNLHIIASAGNVALNGIVSAAGSALITATGAADASIEQVTGLLSAGSVRLLADFNVGTTAAAIDLNVGMISAKAGAAGMVVLNQTVGRGGLIIGDVGGVAGIEAGTSVIVTTAADAFTVSQEVVLPLTGSVIGTNALTVAAPIVANAGVVILTAAQGSIVVAAPITATATAAARTDITISTGAGDILLGHRVRVLDSLTTDDPAANSSISVTARQPSGDFGNVIFRGGYLRTPQGVVVGGLKSPLPIPNPVELNASKTASVIVNAGSTASTVDGLLSDVGLRVMVDFIEGQSDFKFANGASPLGGSNFGPFEFTYSDEFLFARSLDAGPDDELFDIVITAQQDSSIQVSEFRGNELRVVTSEGTREFVVSSIPQTEARALLPVVLRVPVSAPFQFPTPQTGERIFEPAPMQPTAEEPAAPVNENADLIDITAASSGAAAADRPRLFLVWQLPGLEDQTGRKEFPIVVLAPQYLRAMVAELPQGRYWFELQEPGADARQVGEKFYVRGGRIDVDVLPEDLGLERHENPFADVLDADNDLAPVSVPATPVAPPAPDRGDDDTVPRADDTVSQVIRPVSESDGDAVEVEETAAAGVAAFGAMGLMKGRWRRRFEAVEMGPVPRLHKAARLSRRIRRAAK